MKKAYIHIGLAKTGSTAIQGALSTHEATLEEHGWRYLKAGRFGHASGHHKIAWHFQEHRKDIWDPSLEQKIRKELQEARNLNVVLSSEEFSLLSYQGIALRKFLELLDDYHKTVIVYVRHQPSLFNSFYVEIVKNFDYWKGVGPLVKGLRMEPRYDYTNWLDSWRANADELIVRPFDKDALLEGDVVSDFFELLEVPKGSMFFSRANDALDPVSIALTRGARLAIYRHELVSGRVPPETLREVKRRIHAVIRNGLEEDMLKQRFWGIQPALFNSLCDQYRDINSRFFEIYTGEEFQFSDENSIKAANTVRITELESFGPRVVELYAHIQSIAVRDILKL